MAFPFRHIVSFRLACVMSAPRAEYYWLTLNPGPYTFILCEVSAASSLHFIELPHLLIWDAYCPCGITVNHLWVFAKVQKVLMLLKRAHQDNFSCKQISSPVNQSCETVFSTFFFDTRCCVFTLWLSPITDLGIKCDNGVIMDFGSYKFLHILCPVYKM